MKTCAYTNISWKCFPIFTNFGRAMLIYADKVFENPIEVIEAFCPNQVKPALDKVDFLKNKGKLTSPPTIIYSGQSAESFMGVRYLNFKEIEGLFRESSEKFRLHF